MGLTRLRTFLGRHTRVALDTSIFIYQLEANSRYIVLTDQIFTWIEQRNHSAATSTITMAELLVHPYREGDDQRANEFYSLLFTYPNLDWIPPGLEIADLAARIRAACGLRAPDALQAACAIQAGATGFITNDRVFKRVDAFETLVLEELL